ncbi:hypothetical protein BT63DRAFT_205265 [Microthyrium microscopicum]|uniref:Uncharacterized protein n=1 Tax=Microthyrium microscopicum TaxID=703497 RepID=A0A6A6UFK8_9PEZI|nr:hypothetical protein BT63DRAFT_205265 [Microthyrium microscopicum]
MHATVFLNAMRWRGGDGRQFATLDQGNGTTNHEPRFCIATAAGRLARNSIPRIAPASDDIAKVLLGYDGSVVFPKNSSTPPYAGTPKEISTAHPEGNTATQARTRISSKKDMFRTIFWTPSFKLEVHAKKSSGLTQAMFAAVGPVAHQIPTPQPCPTHVQSWIIQGHGKNRCSLSFPLAPVPAICCACRACMRMLTGHHKLAAYCRKAGQPIRRPCWTGQKRSPPHLACCLGCGRYSRACSPLSCSSSYSVWLRGLGDGTHRLVVRSG